MILASDDPRLIRLDTMVRSLRLTTEHALSCLLWAASAYSPQGAKAVKDLRAATKGTDTFTFNFDDFADAVGVTPDVLFSIYENGIALYGERIKLGGGPLQ
jgi:hypothetical protein